MTSSDPVGLSDEYSFIHLPSPELDPCNTAPVAKINVDRSRVIRPHMIINAAASESYDNDGDALEYLWAIWTAGYSEYKQIQSDRIQLDLDGKENPLTLSAVDTKGNIGLQRIQFGIKSAPPFGNCLIDLYEKSSLFHLTVEYYNNSDSPIEKWQTAWKIDSAMPISNMQIDKTEYLSNNIDLKLKENTGENTTTVTVRGLDDDANIPPYSWVKFKIIGESTKPLNNITFLEALGNLECSQLQKPKAVIVAEPISGSIPLTVSFSAEDSYIPYHDEVTYNWSFGDGTKAEGKTVKHTYKWSGNFDVQLWVNDQYSRVGADKEIKVTGYDGTVCEPSITREYQDKFKASVRLSKNDRNTLSFIEPRHLQLSLSHPVTIVSGEGVDTLSNQKTKTLNIPLNNLNLSLGGNSFNRLDIHEVNFLLTTTDGEKPHFTDCTVE